MVQKGMDQRILPRPVPGMNDHSRGLVHHQQVGILKRIFRGIGTGRSGST